MAALVIEHEAFSIDSLQKQLFFIDDFEGDQLQDEWFVAGAAGYSVAVVDAQTGGAARLTTHSDNGDSVQLYWNFHRTLLVTKNLAIEYRSLVDQRNLTEEYDFISDLSGNEQIGLYRSGAGNFLQRTRAGGIQTENNSTIARSGDGVYLVSRIQTSTQGGNHVHFYYDGIESPVGSPVSTNIPIAYLEPYFEFYTDEAVAHYLQLDYITVRQDR